MTSSCDIVKLIAGACVALLLQLMLAPNIALFGAQPNFIAAYVLALCLACPEKSGPVMAFVLGLFFDLMGSAPVGGMALLLLVATALLTRAFQALNNDTLFMPIFLMAVFFLLIELSYGVLLVGFGSSEGIVQALIYKALPCTLYDCVIGFITYLCMLRFLASAPKKPQGITLR